MYGPAVPSVNTVSGASAVVVAVTLRPSKAYRVRKWAEAIPQLGLDGVFARIDALGLAIEESPRLAFRSGARRDPSL